MINFLIQLLGGIDNLFFALIVFIFSEYITGIFVAIVEKKWIPDNLGIKGLLKKMAILILINIANIIDTLIIGNKSITRPVVILFYLSNEGLMILENLKRLDMVLPKALEKIIKQLSQDEKDN